MNKACGDDGTVVHASGGIPGDIHKLWRSQARNDYHSEYGYSLLDAAHKRVDDRGDLTLEEVESCLART